MLNLLVLPRLEEAGREELKQFVGEHSKGPWVLSKVGEKTVGLLGWFGSLVSYVWRCAYIHMKLMLKSPTLIKRCGGHRLSTMFRAHATKQTCSHFSVFSKCPHQ